MERITPSGILYKKDKQALPSLIYPMHDDDIVDLAT